MSSRPIPPRPSLEFDRKQARALLAALREGDRAAEERFRAHHPRFLAVGAAGSAALHDAQLVIAREYGFSSWPRWKQFVEARQLDTGQRAAALVRAACAGTCARPPSSSPLSPPWSASISTRRVCAGRPSTWPICSRAIPPSRDQRTARSIASRSTRASRASSAALDARRAAGIVRGAAPPRPRRGRGGALHGDRGSETDTNRPLRRGGHRASNAELTDAPRGRRRRQRAQGTPGDDVHAVSCGLETLYHASEFADVTCLRLLSRPVHPSIGARLLLPRPDDRLRESPGVDLYLSTEPIELPHSLDARSDAPAPGRGVRPKPRHRPAPRRGGRRPERHGRPRPDALSSRCATGASVADLLRAAGGRESQPHRRRRMPARIDPSLLCCGPKRRGRGCDSSSTAAPVERLGRTRRDAAAPLGVLAVSR